MSEPIISLRRVRFGYRAADPAVLDDVSLEILPGQAVAILGPNGAGKTTLLQVLLGALPPQGGEVWLAGTPQARLGRRETARLIGLVPQIEHVQFEFSVLEYVLMGRAPHLGVLDQPSESDYRIALDTLEGLGLAHLRERPVPDLSGGERQMVLLARALAQQTDILLLDEPTAHLDLSNKGRLLEVLVDLGRRGTTVVFSTHDPDAAALVAQHMILMREGRIVDAGPVERVLTSEKLSATYGVPVHVVEVEGRLISLLARPGR
jgi:iron complex transport system ATP-binding protein